MAIRYEAGWHTVRLTFAGPVEFVAAVLAAFDDAFD